MRHLFYLSTCNTCRNFLRALAPLPGDLVLQDLKHQALQEKQLEQLRKLSGSYEALFNRRSRKYAEFGLKERMLNESDYRKLLLQEYTFLKRPLVVWDEQLYIGASAAILKQLRQELA